MKIGLMDCNGNDIYIGDKVGSKNSSYFVRFGYYSFDDSDPIYGFYLECSEYGSSHHMPYAPTKKLRLEKLNILEWKQKL